MSEPESASGNGGETRAGLGAKYVRWGGVAAILGPLLVLVANVYGLWADRVHGSDPAGHVETVLTTAYLAFGGIRLIGGTLLAFGLITLYAYQIDKAGRLGLVGFALSMVGTILLTAVAWFTVFTEPVIATEAPALLEGVVAGEMGTLLVVGVTVPIIVQAIGWTIFGVATYRAGVFPTRAAIVLVVGALLLFVPVSGIAVVFQLAVAWLGFLVSTGRVEPPSSADVVTHPT